MEKQPDSLPAQAAHLRRRIAELCGLDAETVRGDSVLAGLGLDSIRLIDLVCDLEDTYGIEIAEHDPRLASVKRVADLERYLQQRLDERDTPR